MSCGCVRGLPAGCPFAPLWHRYRYPTYDDPVATGELEIALREAVIESRWRQVWPGVAHLQITERTRLRRTVRPITAAIDAAPVGELDADGRWGGRLTHGHHLASTAAQLATATLEQATRLHPIDVPLGRQLLPQIFPDDLTVIADAWSDRYHRNPKAWDRNRGIEAMFDWAQQGLIEPPARPGAVLLLITGVPSTLFARILLTYLLERPVLLRTTLPLLFTTPGIKGASAAQRDACADDGGLAGYVIPQLIDRGIWQRDEVSAWCARALEVPRSEYEFRWFPRLAEELREGP